MKLKKDGVTPKKSGGANGGDAGRPPKEESKKKTKAFILRPSPEVAAILAEQTNKTAFIECAILAYKVRLFEKQETILL